MQSSQFLFEVVRRDRSPDVEVERRRIDTRRDRPVPALKFPGHDPVEMHHPDGDAEQDRDAREDQRQAPAAPLGACHADFSPGRWTATIDRRQASPGRVS
jgi:hypothetical protein